MADQLSLEQKILETTQIAEQAVQLFSPGAAKLIEAGVAVEPVISGLAQLIIGLFRHHVSQPAPVKPAGQ